MNLNLLVDQNNPFSSYNLSESLIIKYPNKKRWGAIYSLEIKIGYI